MLPANATIVMDEGYDLAKNTPTEALERHKYIVDVHPANDDPAFRVELQVWVAWPERPDVGDVVNALYTPGSTEAVIVLEGDERFDWNLRRANAQASAASERDALLDSPPDTPAS